MVMLMEGGGVSLMEVEWLWRGGGMVSLMEVEWLWREGVVCLMEGGGVRDGDAYGGREGGGSGESYGS